MRPAPIPEPTHQCLEIRPRLFAFIAALGVIEPFATQLYYGWSLTGFAAQFLYDDGFEGAEQGFIDHLTEDIAKYYFGPRGRAICLEMQDQQVREFRAAKRKGLESVEP